MLCESVILLNSCSLFIECNKVSGLTVRTILLLLYSPRMTNNSVQFFDRKSCRLQVSFACFVLSCYEANEMPEPSTQAKKNIKNTKPTVASIVN